MKIETDLVTNTFSITLSNGYKVEGVELPLLTKPVKVLHTMRNKIKCTLESEEDLEMYVAVFLTESEELLYNEIEAINSFKTVPVVETNIEYHWLSEHFEEGYE